MQPAHQVFTVIYRIPYFQFWYVVTQLFKKPQA
jgi:hypothetical protein